jgi:hypothetical protein
MGVFGVFEIKALARVLFGLIFMCLLMLSVLGARVERERDREGNRRGGRSRERGSAEVFKKGEEFAGRTVYSAIINTDPKMAMVMGRDFHKVPQGVKGSPVSNAYQRLDQSRRMTSELPFPVETWWSVFTSSCPHTTTKGNDRGVMLAHYQIWSAFAYRERQGGIRNTMVEHDNDDDVLVIFEDDANIAVTNVTQALHSELSVMKVDLLFLGWCYGRRYIPACLHAYAITRAGARKLVDNWDICSNDAIDGQLRDLSKELEGVFTWDKAADATFLNSLRPGFEDNPNYFTRGIFVQKNGLVSFNHHGFQNNAG